MIPIQPWLVPLLVMAILVAGVAVALGISTVSTLPDKLRIKLRISSSKLRVSLFGILALVLVVGAVYTVVYGEEVVTRLTAFATFIPAAFGAYYALTPLSKRRQREKRDKRVAEGGEQPKE